MVVVFANEPPAYREAMCRAFIERTGADAAARSPTEVTEDELATARLVVASDFSERAADLSLHVAVVNLSYGPGERAAVFREGEEVASRELGGLGDLVSLIEETLVATG